MESSREQFMKIPAGTNGLLRTIVGGDAAQAGRSARSPQNVSDAFRNILESQRAPAGSASGGNPAQLPDEKKIRELIELIRLRMMLDETMLQSMRDGGSDASLYQRFARSAPPRKRRTSFVEKSPGTARRRCRPLSGFASHRTGHSNTNP
jgi:hypothetical protein